MKKKLFRYFVTGLSAVILLAGCTSNSSTEESSQKGANKGNETLTVWAWNVNVPIIEEAGKLYAKENPGFALDIVEIANKDVYQKATTALQAKGKGLPDIVLIEDDKVPEYVNKYPNSFLNLTENGFSPQEGAFPNFKLNVAKNDNDDIFAFPFDVGPSAVFYRKDLFEKAGLDISSIKTWDDYLEAGKQLKEKTGVYLLPLEQNSNDMLYRLMMNQQGNYYFNDKNEIAFLSEESIRSLEMIEKLVNSGVVEDVADWNGQTSSITNSKSATIPSGAWMAGTLISEAGDQSEKWGLMDLPVFSDNDNSVHASNAGGSSFLIPSTGDQVDLSFEFMEFFTESEEVQKVTLENGIFPSLMSMYDLKNIDNEVTEYFGEEDVYGFFKQVLQEVPERQYNEFSAEAKAQVVVAQSKILMGQEKIEKALLSAKKELENRIN